MPSKDPIDAKANAWMEPRKKASVSRPSSALLVRIALKLGVSPETLAARIPEDTLRRLKYPVVEVPQPDGSTLYRHDLGISEGRISKPLR